MVKLRCCDITFDEVSMTVYIASSKADRYRQGDSILVACTGFPMCPVAMMEKYFAMAELSLVSQLTLFRRITYTRKGERLRSSRSLSYTHMRELFLYMWKKLSFDTTKFGLHSLRAGGASAEAKVWVSGRLFKCHGRWKSESARMDTLKIHRRPACQFQQV